MPFDLGHPLGPPGREDFQLDVLRSSLQLLERDGPLVLADYPHEAPASSSEPSGWACPIALPPPDPGENDTDRLAAKLEGEVDRLRPWYDEGLRARNRTTVGLSGLAADGLAAAAPFLAALATGADVADPPPGTTIEMPALLRFIADDLKAYYFEAATARPGQAEATPDELRDWLFFETTLGDVLLRIRDRFVSAEDEQHRRLQAGLVPGAVILARDTGSAGADPS